MTGKLLEIKRTYSAKLFTVECQHGDFKIAGTLDGFIDLAIPQGDAAIDSRGSPNARSARSTQTSQSRTQSRQTQALNRSAAGREKGKRECTPPPQSSQIKT